MTIANLAGVLSGLQPPVYIIKNMLNNGNAATGLYSSSWFGGGNPVAGAYDTTLNGVTLSSASAGTLTFYDPPTGDCYLARLQGSIAAGTGTPAAAGNYLLLCDRLWHNGGLDITGASSPQAITSPTWPARDIDGTAKGEGVFLACELSAQASTGTAPASITIGYTNSKGVSGRTASCIVTIPAGGTAAFQERVFLFSLQAGDTGVKSVESFSIATGWTAGTINILAYRPIAMLGSFAYRNTTSLDAITGGLPQIFPGSALFFIMGYNGGGGSQFVGNVQYTFG